VERFLIKVGALLVCLGAFAPAVLAHDIPADVTLQAFEGPAPSDPEYTRVEGPAPSDPEHTRVEG
jgi:hypothetical protein